MKTLLILLSLFILSNQNLFGQLEQIRIEQTSFSMPNTDREVAGFQWLNHHRFAGVSASATYRFHEKWLVEARVATANRFVRFEYELAFTDAENPLFPNRKNPTSEDNRFYSLGFFAKYELFNVKDNWIVLPSIGLDTWVEQRDNRYIEGLLIPNVDPDNQSAAYTYTEFIHRTINPFVNVGLDIQKKVFSRLYFTMSFSYQLPLMGVYSSQEVEFVQFFGNFADGPRPVERTEVYEERFQNTLFMFQTRAGISYNF
jgi:hypothetical protein